MSELPAACGRLGVLSPEYASERLAELLQAGKMEILR